MIVTREQFKEWIQEQFQDHPNMAADESALWIPEDQPGLQCSHFVFGRTDSFNKTEYWSWCLENMQGKVRCFWANSDTGDEWWGFTEYNDVALWILRWAQ